MAICPFTKYITAKAVPNATSLAAAQVLVSNAILVYGCVREIFPDESIHFTGHTMQGILKPLDTKHLLTTSYHAEADGAAERRYNFLSIF